MRPFMWILLYLLLALAMIPVFVAILSAKAATNNPRVWANVDSEERKQAKIKVWSDSFLCAVVWPGALVGLGIYYVIAGIDIGVPREIKKAMKRKKDREIIAQWEKEQYGETKDLP